MKIHEILSALQKTQGTNAKLDLFHQYLENQFLLRAIKLALDPFITFGVVKVPQTDSKIRNPMPEGPAWTRFFGLAEKLSARQLTGNEAIYALSSLFELCNEEDERWMRAILEKRLGIGLSSKLFNRIIPGFIPEFEVSLAHPYDFKRMKGWSGALVEPKIDGIRCIAMVRNGNVTMMGRSGKEIENFQSTVGMELLSMPDGCYDGEIAGTNFQSLMEQAYRKDNHQIDDVTFHIFDYLTLREWDDKHHSCATFSRREALVEMFSERKPFEFLELVAQHAIEVDDAKIHNLHDAFVSKGYEGAMIKNPDAGYNLGRSHDVMKLKSFHDIDLPIECLVEGTGKHVGKMGAVVVRNGKQEVQVGSGFTDALRVAMWSNPESYIGSIIEIQFQEETKDGSLRFPTFVRFRDDKS